MRSLVFTSSSLRPLSLIGAAFLATGTLATIGCGDSGGDTASGGASGTTSSSQGAGGGGATTATGSSSTGGGPTSCTPMAGATVGASCGVFVRPGAAGSGTLASPLGTLAEALTASGGTKPIYVCSGTLPEHGTLPAGSTIYGGLDCTAGYLWRIAPAEADRTVLTGKDPVHLASGASKTTLFGLAVRSDDATTPGASSIAVVAEQVEASFSFVSFHAGNGAPGEDGAAPVGQGVAGAQGQDGTFYSGPPQLCFAAYTGGAATANPTCPTSIGGKGGNGAGVAGGLGTAGLNGQPNGGMGGAAGTCVGALCAINPGEPGSPGATGADGMGAAGLGSISTVGFVGASGAQGTSGGVGNGGGGGGGGVFKSCGGDGGGSGGSGGCGGEGGAGGMAGGASIAIVSLAATLSFESCDASVGAGGHGGAGGDGQPGGTGADGGNGHNAGHGGKGGDGGSGGKGGGGGGGHAIGLAYTGALGSIAGLTIAPIDATKAGAGGAAPHAGANGVALATQMF